MHHTRTILFITSEKVSVPFTLSVTLPAAVLVLILVPGSIGCCVLVAALLFVRYAMPKSHRSLLGKVKVPPVSSRTTLVVTE
jgi:hypothetical protein